jgi:hypothetical protein
MCSISKLSHNRFRIKLVVSEDDVRKSYQRAMDSMARLNRTAARLMHKYNAHGSTDITGIKSSLLLLMKSRKYREFCDTVKPELTTISEQRPPPNSDHLSITTIVLRSQL